MRSSAPPGEFIQLTSENKVELRNKLYQIYMQPHVLPYMSFDYLNEEDFYKLFDDFFAERDIFVLKVADAIVATISIEVHDYTAELVSFAVDANHLGLGYGKQCYNEIDKLLKTNDKYKDVLRVEQSQETDNPVALHLAEKMGYQTEAVFPDWLKLIQGSKKPWLNGERFLSTFTDAGKVVAKHSIVSAKQFSAKLPELVSEVPHQFDIKQNGNNISCSFQQKLQATISVKCGVRRFDHLQFYSINAQNDCNVDVLKQCLRKIIVDSAKNHKKVEVFSSNQMVIDCLRDLGFHCRGEKIATNQVNQQYYNEIGADFGFFNCEDVKNALVAAALLNDTDRERLFSALDLCKQEIGKALDHKQIDEYAKLYLENMAFQMTREVTLEKFYEYEKAPWQALIQSLPSQIKLAFEGLQQVLGQMYVVMNLNQSVTFEERQNAKTVRMTETPQIVFHVPIIQEGVAQAVVNKKPEDTTPFNPNKTS